MFSSSYVMHVWCQRDCNKVVSHMIWKYWKHFVCNLYSQLFGRTTRPIGKEREDWTQRMAITYQFGYHFYGHHRLRHRGRCLCSIKREMTARWQSLAIDANSYDSVRHHCNIGTLLEQSCWLCLSSGYAPVVHRSPPNTSIALPNGIQ